MDGEQWVGCCHPVLLLLKGLVLLTHTGSDMCIRRTHTTQFFVEKHLFVEIMQQCMKTDPYIYIFVCVWVWGGGARERNSQRVYVWGGGSEGKKFSAKYFHLFLEMLSDYRILKSQTKWSQHFKLN